MFQGGNTENLSRFLFEFEAAVNRYNLAEYDKLLLLKQLLKGRASYLINSLELNNQNYSNAVELLKKAFLCRETQVFNLVQNLSSIKLGIKDDPYQFISQIRNLLQCSETINNKVEDFFHYFVWEGLNIYFKNNSLQSLMKLDLN